MCECVCACVCVCIRGNWRRLQAIALCIFHFYSDCCSASLNLWTKELHLRDLTGVCYWEMGVAFAAYQLAIKLSRFLKSMLKLIAFTAIKYKHTPKKRSKHAPACENLIAQWLTKANYTVRIECKFSKKNSVLRFYKVHNDKF